MDHRVNVPAFCVAAVVFSDVSVDMPTANRDRLIAALRANAQEKDFWIRRDDAEALVGACENGGAPLLPVTDNGRYQSWETKLPDGHIKLDYESICWTYIYETIKKAL